MPQCVIDILTMASRAIRKATPEQLPIIHRIVDGLLDIHNDAKPCRKYKADQ